MESRVVVSFRAAAGPGRGFLERAAALIARVSAIGGAHIGWDVLKMTFAFDPSLFPAVIELLTTPGADTVDGEPLWGVGIAQGDLEPVKQEGSPILSSGLFWWGPPFVAASSLAGVARPGELLCAQTVRALRMNQLVTSGIRVVRDGTLRVRGARIDRTQPWRMNAVDNLSILRDAPLVTSHLPSLALEPGGLLVLRAEAGAGGTRLLREIAARAPSALTITPAGSGLEPFGALRRAMSRAMLDELRPHFVEEAAALEALGSGRGVSLDTASWLITRFLRIALPAGGAPSALIVDHARAIDPSTLAACVQAVQLVPELALVVRLDATSGLPSVLAGLQRSAERELPALSREGAEAIAMGSIGGFLDASALRRWTLLGGGSPLAIVEAVTHGLASGELGWSGELLTPRSRRAGRGGARTPAHWIRARAETEDPATRAVLAVLAVAGGDASVASIGKALDRAGVRVDLTEMVPYLERARWVTPSIEDPPVLTFPSRTHQRALYTMLDEDSRQGWHRALARVIDEEDGVFGRVEAGWHAAQAGDGIRAAATLLEAAVATADSGLEASTTQLIALARRADPACEDVALELLANVLARSPSGASPKVSLPPPTARSAPPHGAAPSFDSRSGPARVAALASVPPQPRTASVPEAPAAAEPDSMIERALIVGPDSMIARAMSAIPRSGPSPTDGGQSIPPDDEAPGSQIAARLGQVAKDALIAGDNAALDRWLETLAAGDTTAYTERMRALARLRRGDIGDALRVLRRARAKLEPSDHRQRCQMSLALGVALSVAGRPQDALLEALDALARARQISDAQGAGACLAFLAKLYASVSREADAERLRGVHQ